MSESIPWLSVRTIAADAGAVTPTTSLSEEDGCRRPL